jgi:hypothetical protein
VSRTSGILVLVQICLKAANAPLSTAVPKAQQGTRIGTGEDPQLAV